MREKKNFIKPLLAVIPVSATLLINCETIKAEDIVYSGNVIINDAVNVNNIAAVIDSKINNKTNVTATEVLSNQGSWTNSVATSTVNASTLNQYGTLLNLGSVDAYDFSTYSGSKTENQSQTTVTHVLLNQGNWINGGSASQLNASNFNQKGSVLNQGTIETYDFSTYSGSTTQNQGEISVSHVFLNNGSLTNEGSNSSLDVKTFNQKGTVLNQGLIEADALTTYSGSNTQNQGDISVVNALVNQGVWSNSTSDSSIVTSTLNQENSMINLGSIETTTLTTFAGSNTENQGSVKVNNVLVNKGDWTNGGANSSLNASTLNQEATMLNQGSIVATNMTTIAGSNTENQGSVKVNNVFVNKGDWINGTSESSINAAKLNQENTMLNLGSITATDFTTFAGSETINQANVKVNNVLANKGNWNNRTVDSVLNASTLNQEATMLNHGSITATDFTTYSGSTTENFNTVKVNNVLANKGDWTNAAATSKIIASTLNQESDMLNLGSITATNFSTFADSTTENQGSVKVNNVMSNEGNWINGGADSSITTAVLNQKSQLLNQGTIIATDFSTYADSKTENQGSVTVNNALSNEGRWINGNADSELSASTINQKGSMLNLGSVEASDLTTYADSKTENQGEVTVSHVLANKGKWTNGGQNSKITATTLNQETTMLNQGSIEAVDLTTFSDSRTENQGDVSVSHVLANKGQWINGSENSSLTAENLNQENSMLNLGTISATNLTTFSDSTTDNQGNVSVSNVLVNKGSLMNSSADSIVNAKSLNQEGSMLNIGSITSNFINTSAESQTDNQGEVTVNQVFNNKGSWINSTSDSSLTAKSLNQDGILRNRGLITSNTVTTLADSETDNQGNINVSGAVVNNGTYKNSTSSSSLTAASFTNESGATFVNSGILGSTTRRVNNINIKSGSKSFVNNASGKIYATTVSNDATLENKSGGNINSVDFINKKTLTNNGIVNSILHFTNTAGAKVTNNGVEGQGTLNVLNASNDGEITQGTVIIANNGVFNNNDNGSVNIEKSLNVKGVLKTTNDINVQNSTHNAALINENTITAASASITADTMTASNRAVMNLSDSKLAIVYQTNDIKGIINVLGGADTESDIAITGSKPTFSGNLNVGNSSNKSVLNLLSGDVTKNANVTIASGAVVNIDDSGSAGTSSIVIDGTDNWSGDINNVSGNVEIFGKTFTSGKTSTTEGGKQPYYSQTDGDLILTNSNITMEDSSVINGNGSIFVDSLSKFNSNSGTFNVSNLQNAGLINGINGTYEAYVAKERLIAGKNGDEQADFTTDLYIRSNADKKYDKFGSPDAILSAGADSRHGVMNISDFKIHGDLFGKDAPIDREIVLNNIFDYSSVQAGDRIDFKATNKTIPTAIGNYGLVSRGNGTYALRLKSFNPNVYRGQVTTLAQYQNQLAIDDMLFNHTMLNNGFKGNDYLSSHPNLYASSSDLYAPYQYSRKDGGLWVKAYGTFEKLKLTSIDADNNSYGTLIGADFGLKNLKRGWQFMPTAYLGYNGANQKWDGIDAFQNGGQLGFLGTWYKNDFMIGALAYGGLYVNEMKTPKGNDDNLGYFLGAATKTAYNWKIKRDFSLQPNLMLSYNFFGKQNWNTSFGQMDMQTGMLNGINIAPGLNFIWEKETFSMYATLQYMVNINDGVTGKSGNIDLPEQKMDSIGYVQYGIGINKKFTDRFSGFFQAVFRNLSRTGVGLQLGVNFKLGKAPVNNTNKKSTKLPKKQKTKMNVSSAKTN